MDATVKAVWVATLRSDNYKQAKATLRTSDNSCCCLGVLCDIVAPQSWSTEKPQQFLHFGESGMPTQEFLDSVELKYQQAQKLAQLNDSGANFHQIADHIEKHL